MNNPNCGRCGNLNHNGYCSLTACVFPVVPPMMTIQVPQTNADRLRYMSDGKLAEWIANRCPECPPGQRPAPVGCDDVCAE